MGSFEGKLRVRVFCNSLLDVHQGEGSLAHSQWFLAAIGDGEKLLLVVACLFAWLTLERKNPLGTGFWSTSLPRIKPDIRNHIEGAAGNTPTEVFSYFEILGKKRS